MTDEFQFFNAGLGNICFAFMARILYKGSPSPPGPDCRRFLQFYLCSLPQVSVLHVVIRGSDWALVSMCIWYLVDFL